MSTRLPFTALDIQLDLLRYYEVNMFGRTYADGVVEAALRDKANWMPGMGRRLHRSMLTGDTYAVTSEIMDVLEQAAPSVPRFIIHESDLPTPSGFVWLERAIILKDIHNRNLAVRAIGWHLTKLMLPDETLEPAVLTLCWTDPTDPRDHAHGATWGDLSDVGMPMNLASMITGCWPIGRTWGELAEPYDPGESDDSVENISADLDLGKVLLAFLRFINEPWINTEHVRPDRGLRRRAERAFEERPEHVPEIHVVHLRRRGGNPTESGTGNIEWSHRWLVRGHWRNHWYPKLGVHKPRWIAEHIKGPDGLPLVVHDKVFSVER